MRSIMLLQVNKHAHQNIRFISIFLGQNIRILDLCYLFLLDIHSELVLSIDCGSNLLLYDDRNKIKGSLTLRLKPGSPSERL